MSLSYLSKRFFEALVVLLLVSFATFCLMKIVPGGPFDSERPLPPEIKKNLMEKYHLDQPFWVQYGQYLQGLSRLDLGPSMKYLGRSVNDIVYESLPISLQLGFWSLILTLLLGIPLGVVSAYKHNTWWDSSAMFIAVSGVALPNFLLASLLILIFAQVLGILPVALWEGPEHAILPVITMGLRPAAIIARLTRASLLEVLPQDFIRTARAKGVSDFVLLSKHALRNALIPVLTFLGPLTANLITGSFVVEQMFAIPGMAKHFIMAVSNRDYPLIMGLTLVYAVILVLCNFVVDLLYSWVDPRIAATE